MKKYDVHTLTKLDIYSNCDNYENTINDDPLEDPLIFRFSTETRRKVCLSIVSTDRDDKNIPEIRVEFDVDDIEHLHSWLGVLLRNKTESKLTI